MRATPPTPGLAMLVTRAQTVVWRGRPRTNAMYRVCCSGRRDEARRVALRMFERFTDQARHIVTLAQEEARRLNHNDIGTEDILLALIHEGSVIAAQARKALGITEEAARQRVEETADPGQQSPRRGRVPFTPLARKVLELSLREAIAIGSSRIGTEHILLGLVRL